MGFRLSNRIIPTSMDKHGQNSPGTQENEKWAQEWMSPGIDEKKMSPGISRIALLTYWNNLDAILSQSRFPKNVRWKKGCSYKFPKVGKFTGNRLRCVMIPTVAHLNLKLRGRGAVVFACPAGFSSFCDCRFAQNKGGEPTAPPQISHWKITVSCSHLWD